MYKGDYQLCHKASGIVRETPEKRCLAAPRVFFQRYMNLYMIKTRVQLHYTSLSVLDYALVTVHKTGSCNFIFV